VGFNADQTLDLIHQGHAAGAAILLFPELGLSAYAIDDLLLQQAATWLKTEFKDLKGIVTLSPQTTMAERFHLKNGAKIRKTNETTVNYEYYFKD
jgi:predicted amidohydrolase